MKILAWVPLLIGTVFFIKLPFPYSFIFWMLGAYHTDNLRQKYDPNRPPDTTLVRQLRFWGWILGVGTFLPFLPSKLCLIGFVTCLTSARLLSPDSKR